MKLRIDRVVGGPEERPIERWELLAGGRLVLTLEAADLHALAAEAMRADGQRQGLELAATYPDVLEADVRGSVEGLDAPFSLEAALRRCKMQGNGNNCQ